MNKRIIQSRPRRIRAGLWRLLRLWRGARQEFDGDPRYWKIIDGKLYLNLNGVQAEWSKDISGNLAKAETNWRRIVANPVAAL